MTSVLDSDISPEDQPVHIDIERMKRALAGPRYRVPHGMTVDQICAFMDEVSKSYFNALEEAAQAVDAVLANWNAEGDAGQPALTSSNNVNIALERAAAAIRELKNPR